MTIAISTLFFIVCVGLAIWFKKDSSFRPREVIAVSAFWILFVATPFGSGVVKTMQDAIGSGAQTGVATVTSVSSK
ncbi:hypothetical protein ACIQMV_08710 [Streptomyces sp. NPDC091412]|uniref:hypothetical protein n=1 Tax=Streptomyces sp. NPDC091412 TaxID=3366002 RepID=UPI0038152919